jgi:hypothetical protein
VLVILDANRVLDQETPKAVATLREHLEMAAREWGQPEGGEWPRPAKPFRVVLQCLPVDADFVRSVWPSAADGPPA